MKKLLILCVVLFASCEKKSVSSSTTKNGIKIEFMFEKDGVKIYRFEDSNRYHYFTTKGEIINPQKESNGHSVNYYDDNIN